MFPNERVDKLNYRVKFLDMWRVSTVRQFCFLVLTAVAFVAVEHEANLRFHRLRRVNFRSRPAGDEAKLTEIAEIEEKVFTGYPILLHHARSARPLLSAPKCLPRKGEQS